MDKSQVLNIARTARIGLSDDEAADFAPRLAAVAGYVRMIDGAETGGVEPMYRIASGHDPLRDDVEAQSLAPEVALANGPSVKKGHFAVPKVIGGGEP